MLLSAVVLLLGLLLVLLAAAGLARAAWPERAPGLGLLLWQALGLTGGLVPVLLLSTVALAPHGPDHVAALRAAGISGTTWWSAAAGLLAVVLLVRLLLTLAGATATTLGQRRRHRLVLDLVATRNPLVRGAQVVESALPVAYCVPGLRPRVVVSQGALLRLSPGELDAVVAHERAHLDQRHDLVVLPFVALRRALAAVPLVPAAAAEVALLVEMLADDAAARKAPRPVLARALYAVGQAPVPAGGLGVNDATVLRRARRLLTPPAPLGVPGRALVLGGAVLALGVGPAALVLPLL